MLNTHYVTDSFGQESGSALAGWFWLQGSHEAGVRLLAWAQGSASKKAHSALQASAPYHVSLSVDSPQNMT